jgi:hypothetical protein
LQSSWDFFSHSSALRFGCMSSFTCSGPTSGSSRFAPSKRRTNSGRRSRGPSSLRAVQASGSGARWSVNYYFERVILPYRPRAVVLYAGENDLGALSRKTPEAVFEDFKLLVRMVQETLPGTRVYFLAIKRSPFRRRRWAAMDQANRHVREFAANCNGVAFIDTCTPMLDAAGRPRQEFLPWYRFHLTTNGYKLWASIVKPMLEVDLEPDLGSRPAGRA